MLGLHIDILIIGHKFCSVVNILTELTLQKELHNFMKNNVFWTKKQKNKTKKANIKTLGRAEN